MSVSVRIKQKSLFKKKLNIEEIIKLTNLFTLVNMYRFCSKIKRKEGFLI